jgi:hypothetical protein
MRMHIMYIHQWAGCEIRGRYEVSNLNLELELFLGGGKNVGLLSYPGKKCLCFWYS